MNPKKHILLFGASGSLGFAVAKQILQAHGSHFSLTIADYNPQRGEQVAKSLDPSCSFIQVNIKDQASLQNQLRNVDYAIITFKQDEPYIQRACVKEGVSAVDVNLSYDFYTQLKELHPEAEEKKILLTHMAGYFPGLSALLMNEMRKEFPQANTMNLSLLTSSNVHYTPGLGAIIEMMSALMTPVEYQDSQGSYLAKGLSKTRWVPFLQGKKYAFLASYDEKKALQDLFPKLNFNYWIGSDKRSFSRKLSLLNGLGFLNPFMANRLENQRKKAEKRGRLILRNLSVNPHKPENSGINLEAVVEEEGKRTSHFRSLSVPSDYEITAKVAAALPLLMEQSQVKGVRLPMEFTDLKTLLSVIPNHQVEISESWAEEASDK